MTEKLTRTARHARDPRAGGGGLVSALRGLTRTRPKVRAAVAMFAAVLIGVSGMTFASPAGAAEAKMSWTIAPTGATVLSGGSVSYNVNLECSNLDPDACVRPELRIDPPQDLDATVVATDPSIEASGVELEPQDDGSVVLVFDDMNPGTTRQALLTWRVPNFTVLPGTELEIEGELSYVPGSLPEVTGVAPLQEPDAVATSATPAVNVTKTMVDPTSADQVNASTTATYRLTACLPGEQLGQLDYTHLTLTDSLSIEPAEPAGSEAKFTELDGGTLSADGRSLTWEFDFTADTRPLCGTENAIVKEVSVNYPLGMKPTTPPDGSVQNRKVVNNLDASATLITGEVITSHDEQNHTFSSADYTGRNHLQPYQGAASSNTTPPAADPIVKGDTDTEFRWNDYVNWGPVRGDGPADERSAAIFESIACMTNPINGVPTSLDLSKYKIGGAMEVRGLFAADGAYTAPVLAQQCQDPAFKTTTVNVAPSQSPREDGVPGGHHDAVRVTVYYWDSAANTSGSRTLVLDDIDAGETRAVPVYEADGFDLSDTQTVTDILAVGSPTLWDSSHWALRPVGVQSDSFAASDYMAMTNQFVTFLSGVSSDGTLSGVGNANAVEDSYPGSRTKTFVDQVVIPSVVKTSSDDLTKLQPGDTVRWNITAGNSDLSDTSIRPTVYDVLPVGIEYVPGSAVWSDLDGKAEPEEEIGTVIVDGEERQKITWTFSDDFASGETATVSFDTEVTIAAPAGSHSDSDAQLAVIFDQKRDIGENLNANDVWDLDEDGNTKERVQTSAVDWTITAESGASIEKFVKGSAGDGEWKTEDASIAALEDDDSAETTGTDVDYRISVTNRASNDLKDVVAYDVLPYVGDTGIGGSLADQERGSEFQVDFARLLGSLPDGVSVQYSTSNNPSRPELFPQGQPAGAVDDWSSDLPSDPSTVRALKFTFDALAPGQNVLIDYRGTVPTFDWDEQDQVCLADAPLKAWNNVAIQATTVYANGAERELLPAEAPRVSIREVCGLIGDYAWLDADGNGLQDDGESPVAGVVFQLLDGNGEPVLDASGEPLTATTDENGFYSFNVPEGEWSVQVIEVPEGYDFTVPNAGDDALDSDVTGLNEPSAAVTIDGGHLQDLTLDAGLIGSVSVGDYVWFDLDRDGIQDLGELGIEGVELTLTGPDGAPVTDIHGTQVAPVKTDENGRYAFDDLPVLAEGESYTVTVSDPPAGFVPTREHEGTNRAADSSTGSATSEGLTKTGESDQTLDFGFVPAVSVGDYVWVDTNGNGVQDEGEPGIEGVELTLVGPDGEPVTDVNGDPVAPVRTDADGKYSFDDLPTLPAGQHYTVKVEDPSGYLPTKPNQGDDRAKDSSTGSAESGDLNTPGARDESLDFGFIPAVSVGDYVWVDTNGNGVQDEGEPGIEGVELTLVGPDGEPVTDVNGDPVAPVRTDADGKYSFDGLPTLSGDEKYTVRVTAPEGYAPTVTGAGDRATDSSTGEASTDNAQVDLSKPGASDDTLDFGFVGSVSVGDYVWFDENGDGVQDEGEPGIEGVELTLVGPDGEPVTDVNGDPVAPVRTDADGKYSFDDLPLLADGESYTVTVADPAGYAPTKPGQGDRDRDSSTGSAASTGLTEPGASDDTLDFGFVGTVSVGDYVWKDLDADGVQDEGEPGIEGVELTLVGPDGKPVTDTAGNPVGTVTTDENGYYEFPNLPTLPKDQHYTVKVENPAGLAPTAPEQGDDRGKDSSTGSAESGDLTAPGDRDQSLDFGFVDAEPSVDIEKTDAAGNDADTPAEAVSLPDGGTKLVFTVANDGNEDLVDVVVSDSVTGGTGSVDNLVCTFPDGSIGTSWAGPFAIGAEFTCAADLVGVEPGTSHTDVAKVTGEGRWSGIPTDDDDPFEGNNPGRVSVGDYVWFDVNEDGLQDAGEPGLPDVELTLVGPDGAPVTDIYGNEVLPTRTDATGEYSFENLPVLGEGQSYEVRVTNPEGYSPTAPGAGDDRAKDSSSGSERSGELTKTGDRDATLDFGFVTGNPNIDIEKGDENGNDADTAEEAVSLPDGETGLEFTIVNTGNEDLVDIEVTDQVTEGTGSISGLVCTFPDGSTGTSWAGPFVIGASFDCVAELTGVEPGTNHVDVAKVTGEARYSGVPVDDDDPYEGDNPGRVSVGDYVWSDADNDGVQDAGEEGIAGVTLTLTGPDGQPVTDVYGNPVEPVVTGEDGEYVFENLPTLEGDETYTVTVTPPAGYLPAKEGQGDRGTDSSTGSASTDNGEVDLSKTGVRDDTLDFGFVPTVSVGDYVWEDTNNDGIQDPGEPGIPGVTLELVGPDGKLVTDVNGNEVPPVVTDENGFYEFPDLPVLDPDEHYTVKVTGPEGYDPAKPGQGDDPAKDSSTGEESSGELTEPGDRDDTLDFGFVPTVSVGDYVWLDRDRDGIQEPGEPGIPGVTLTLVGPDGQPVTDVNGKPVEPVVTGENGEYSFEHLPVLADGESYTVQVTDPAGFVPTQPGQGGNRATDSSTGQASSEGLTVPGARDDTLDFGFIPTVSVGDYVWADTDNDGVQDADEPGIAGVTLTLTGPDGQPVTDVFGNPVEPVVTGENGEYVFENLPTLEGDETYTVTVTPPAGYAPAKEGQGDRGTDSSTGSASTDNGEVDLGQPGAKDTTLDFGFVPTVSVGDYVWFDRDEDGVQDEGEPGIPGVTLTLTGPDGKPVTDVNGNPVEPVVTGPNGEYRFDNLPVLDQDEHYTVTVTDPNGYVPTKPGQGDRATDSSTGSASSEGLTQPGDTDTTLDFGFVPTVPVVDIEKVDADGNDADTREESVALPDGETQLTFTVKNLGNEDLVNVAVTDTIVEGTGTVTDLVCTFPDGSTGTEWAGPFEIGAEFTCTATLSGVEAGTSHLDTAKVTAEGRWTGTPTDDEDDYNGHTPKPGISIEKADTAGNDADTERETVRTSQSTRDLVFTVTNTGDEALTDVTVTDEVIRGGATVENLVCVFPDGTRGTSWDGVFEIGASFTCTATVTGLAADDLHIDTAKVTGTGVESGKTVSDDDPYHVVRTPGLPVTGAQGGMIGAAVVGILLLAGGVLLTVRRRREDGAMTA